MFLIYIAFSDGNKFRKTGRHLFLQCFKFGKAMYVIRNKIRVICSKIRVGMEGGPFSIGGAHISQGNMDPGVYIQGGSIYSIWHRRLYVPWTLAGIVAGDNIHAWRQYMPQHTPRYFVHYNVEQDVAAKVRLYIQLDSSRTFNTGLSQLSSAQLSSRSAQLSSRSAQLTLSSAQLTLSSRSAQLSSRSAQLSSAHALLSSAHAQLTLCSAQLTLSSRSAHAQLSSRSAQLTLCSRWKTKQKTGPRIWLCLRTCPHDLTSSSSPWTEQVIDWLITLSYMRPKKCRGHFFDETDDDLYLEYDWDDWAQFREADLLDVDTVDGDPSSGLDQPEQGGEQRRLARPRPTNDTHLYREHVTSQTNSTTIFFVEPP